MNPFGYQRAATVGEAVQAAASGATVLAGGTNLVDHLRLGIRTADRLVDITRIEGLDTVEETPAGGVRIGALVRNSDLAMNSMVRQRFPFVSQALLAGASGQLRNMATTGGNLLQRTRCVYFQDLTTPCNKREPGSGCSALEGLGRFNAIFVPDGATCVAVHPSDLCVPLAALDTTVHVTGPGGERAIAFADLHRPAGSGPDSQPERDTTLEPGEVITAIELDPLPFAVHSRYRKVRERASYAFALVSVAAALDAADGVVRSVRLALGGVAHRPHRATAFEQALVGQAPTADAVRAAIDAELCEAHPGHDNAFKVALVRNTTVAVLGELAQEAVR